MRVVWQLVGFDVSTQSFSLGFQVARDVDEQIWLEASDLAMSERVSW